MGGQLDIFNHDIIGLSGEEEKVWRVVREHTGRGNAIKVDALAWQTGFDGVKVREIVKALVVNHHKLIASSTTSPPGYFVIENEEELKKHIKSLRHRGIAILYRAAQLSRTSITELFHQTVLEFENESVDKK